MNPKTTIPITTQIQKISICKLNTSWLILVTPSVMLRSSQAANALLESNKVNPENSAVFSLCVIFLNISGSLLGGKGLLINYI